MAQDQQGTSLQAANFLRIGAMAGRGQQDCHNQHVTGRKRVYAYELDPGRRCRGWTMRRV